MSHTAARCNDVNNGSVNQNQAEDSCPSGLFDPELNYTRKWPMTATRVKMQIIPWFSKKSDWQEGQVVLGWLPPSTWVYPLPNHMISLRFRLKSYLTWDNLSYSRPGKGCSLAQETNFSPYSISWISSSWTHSILVTQPKARAEVDETLLHLRFQSCCLPTERNCKYARG
jgi:hypothetical protein